MGWISDCFSDVPDPRSGNAQRHDLLEMLTIALAATLSGAESCVDFALFGRSKEALLREFLTLEGGVPSHDAFSRLFRIIDPDAFAACLTRFAQGLADAARQDGVVAIDGKGLRAAFERARGGSPLALVDAFATGGGLAPGQIGGPQGTGEIAALRGLLGLLDFGGRIVAADALHCQKETAQAILDKGADYVLGLKSNRFTMYDDALLFLDDPAVAADDADETVDADHGRIETRRLRVVHDVEWLARRRGFPGLAALADLVAVRETAHALKAVRAHWNVENKLHRVVHAVLDDDRSRARADNGPLNLAVLRPIALNMARTNSANGSIRDKIKRAAWNDAFLVELLLRM